MRIVETSLPGLVAVEPDVHGDERGFFVETYRREWHEQAGIPAQAEFVQDNQSRSTRGVLRGMHFQLGEGVGKLVRCGRGRILDVAVDVRPGSDTYGRWEAVELDDASMRELYVPVGFAHGFCVLSDVADVIYKQTGYYDPQLERGIAYDDPEIGIQWPLPAAELTVSARDAAADLEVHAPHHPAPRARVVVLHEQLVLRDPGLGVPAAPVGLDEEAALVTVDVGLEGDHAGESLGQHAHGGAG